MILYCITFVSQLQLAWFSPSWKNYNLNFFLLPSPYLNKNNPAPIPPMSCPFQTNTTSAMTIACNFGRRRAASAASPCPWRTICGFTLTPCHPVLASPGLGFPVILCNKLLPYLVRNIQQLLNIKGQGEWKPARPFNRKLLQLAGFVPTPAPPPTASKISPASAWNSATKTPQNQRVSKNTPNCLSSCVKLCNDLRPGPWGASHLAKEQLWWLKPLVYHYNEWMRIYLLQNWQISIAALLCFEITYKGNTKMDSFIFARYFFQHGSAQ